MDGVQGVLNPFSVAYCYDYFVMAGSNVVTKKAVLRFDKFIEHNEPVSMKKRRD